MKTGKNADVVLVGSGLAGLETAAELLAGGQRDVLVIESGPARCSGITGPAPWSSSRPPHYPPHSHTPRRQVGGRSLLWHGIVLPLDEWAIQDPVWPASVRRALRGPDGLYTTVQADLACWAGGPLCPPPGLADDLSTLLDFASLRPVPQACLRGPTGGNVAYTPLTRWQLLGGTVEGSHPTVLAERTALEILTTAGRVRGVRVAGPAGMETIGCRILVLAAGTVETTRLVAQIPGRTSGSYEGLNDHLVQGLLLPLPDGCAPPEAIGKLVMLPGGSDSKTNLFLRLHAPTPSRPRAVLDAWTMGEQERSARNTVSVTAVADAPWPARVTCGLSPVDQGVVAAGRSLLGELHARLAATWAFPGAAVFPDLLEAGSGFHAAWDASAVSPVGHALTYAWPLGTVDHEAGTLPLADVLGEDGTVPGADGVYVVGPATFPRSGAANPSLTTLALARWTAHAILAD